MDILMENKYTLIFVLIRMSVILTFGVFFGDKRIPKMIKFGFIFIISMIVAPTVQFEVSGELQSGEFLSILIGEVLIGFIIGYVSSLIITIISTAGSIIDIQGGFGMAQLFDPTTQTQTSVIAQFLTTAGLLCFVLNDLHVTFITLIVDSFKAIPIGIGISVESIPALALSCIRLITSSITIAGCIALPVIGVIFMVDVILGISAKTMPQLNLFSVGYIVKIATTLILLYVYTTTINGFVLNLSKYLFDTIERIL